MTKIEIQLDEQIQLSSQILDRINYYEELCLRLNKNNVSLHELHQLKLFANSIPEHHQIGSGCCNVVANENQKHLQYKERVCVNCSTNFIGRFNRIFCNSKCKSNYHNRLNAFTKRVSGKINSYQRRNRNILQIVLNQEKIKVVSKLKLEELGFRFEIFNGIYFSKLHKCEGKLFYDYLLTEQKTGMFNIEKINMLDQDFPLNREITSTVMVNAT